MALERDRALTVRMVLALLLTALTLATVVATLVLVAVHVHYMLAGFAVLFGVMGLAAGDEPKKSKQDREPNERDRERLAQVVTPLAMLGETAAPELVVVAQRAPLCWTKTRLGGRACIHATTGLLDALDDRQLSAVVAHELSHVINRDARVMTLLAGFPTWFLRHWRSEDNPFAVA
jgi:heat shock protein HtpX